jgi:hypothetical protein
VQKKQLILILILILVAGFLFALGTSLRSNAHKIVYNKDKIEQEKVLAPIETKPAPPPPPPPLDTVLYDKQLAALANGDTSGLWPVKTPYPNPGAILPFKRIVAYYGNLYSKKMGVLGQYDEDEMLARLDVEVKKWEAADPTTPVIPALHYIAVVAQGSPIDGTYRSRMPDTEIDKVVTMADKIHGIVFLDIQVAKSTVQKEIPAFEKYLMMPQVHLGIDPEFSMKTGAKPGTVIGTLDATDINFAVDYLDKLVRDNNLPPKILMIHRFTGPMVTHAENIRTTPNVQVVLDMDGWGPQSMKLGTYNKYVAGAPIEFTGFKLFYKNDILKAGSAMLTPEDLMKLKPIPSYIQYQ